MNAKWCVSAVFFILTLIGFNLEDRKASNQQIVVQFTNVELASNTAQEEALTLIKEKLKVLGVDSFEIVENHAKEISIRYYSTVGAEQVKAFLSVEEGIGVAGTDPGPSKKAPKNNPEKYHIEVSDLQQQLDTGLPIKGTLVTSAKQKENSLLVTLVVPNNRYICLLEYAQKEISYKINDDNVVDPTSHNIPEVRAGPGFSKIS
ncbi:hypothetical protein [Croceivirga radicis]|uniref:hypothetical protein n=1 Tax=Croceivirga radicis TaxID=1929488 RepID=UPI000255B086|nr:hypothetical protein [Croceivirga radicis]